MSQPRQRLVLLTVAVALGLLSAHGIGSALSLPGLVALDVADRLVSVAGIAALTLLTERSLRERRLLLVPLALLTQLSLLVVPALLHAQATAAAYDGRTLLLGAVTQAALTAAVVLAALRLEEAVDRARTRPQVVVHPVVLRPPARRPAALLDRDLLRRPGRGPPLGSPA